MSVKKKHTSTFSPFSTILVFIVLMIIGISITPFLDLQYEPSRTQPGFSVSYSWANASARVIEQEVTSKLEGLFNSIKGVKNVNSVTTRGSGNISLEFKKNVNMDMVRFEAAMLIRQAYVGLPDGVSYPIISLSTSGQNVSPLMAYTINANATPYIIQSYVEDVIQPKIAVLKGVNEISVSGANPFDWEIEFDLDAVTNLGISAQEISDAINSFFSEDILGLGSFLIPGKDYSREMKIVLQSSGASGFEWESIPVKKVNNRIIYLTDIAKIRTIERLPSSYYRINGLNTINMVISPEPSENNIKVGKEVKAKVDEIKKQLPEGYSMILASDQTEHLKSELNKIILRTLFSLIILLLFVFLISRELRYLFLITTSLIANLLIALIFYYVLKLEIHLYSLAGITVSFGIIIDNSIVMIDHIRHQGNKKVFIAILAATLTTIGSLCCIFFLNEADRINLIDFAWVIICNLTVSLLIALFFIPALVTKKNNGEAMQRRFLRRKRRIVRLNSSYSKIILACHKRRWVFKGKGFYCLNV